MQQTEQTITAVDAARSTKKRKSVTGPSNERNIAKRPSSWRIVALILCSLMIGVFAGFLVEKNRINASHAIVSVNGKLITQQELFDKLQASAGVPVMRSLVNDELQMQFAASKGLVPSEADVDARYSWYSRQPNFQIILQGAGKTAKAFREGLKLQMAQEAVFEQGINVSDAEVQKYYMLQADPKNAKALFVSPEIVTLAAIETNSRESAQEASKKVSSGTPFDILARTVSIDPSRTAGGKLDPIRMGQSPLSKDPKLEQEVFNLAPGENFGPVPLGGHWWIFQCEEKSPEVTYPLADVRQQAGNNARLNKGVLLNLQKVKQEFGKFQETANLQAYWPQYQTAINH